MEPSALEEAVGATEAVHDAGAKSPSSHVTLKPRARRASRLNRRRFARQARHSQDRPPRQVFAGANCSRNFTSPHFTHSRRIEVPRLLTSRTPSERASAGLRHSKCHPNPTCRRRCRCELHAAVGALAAGNSAAFFRAPARYGRRRRSLSPSSLGREFTLSRPKGQQNPRKSRKSSAYAGEKIFSGKFSKNPLGPPPKPPARGICRGGSFETHVVEPWVIRYSWSMCRGSLSTHGECAMGTT